MATVLLFLLLTTSSFSSILAATGDPLLLSQYINKGNIGLARTLSRVHMAGAPESYAGFITANETLGNHLFFWLFPTTSPLKPNAPLLLWLEGGPGVTSLLALFTQIGPWDLHPTFPPTVSNRDKSWSSHFSVLYIDNPVGVGFSFTESGNDGLRTTKDGYGMDLHAFLKQFFKMFPEYKSREFYIGGQSYAGHYVPVLAHRIHEDLDRGVKDVPLTGIFIGSPQLDTFAMMDHFFEYWYSLGFLTYADMNNYKANCASLKAHLANNPDANVTSAQVFGVLYPRALDWLSFNNFVTREPTVFRQLDYLVNSWRGILHVGNTRYLSVQGGTELRRRFGKDVVIPVTDELAVLLDNYKVLIYTGDFDALITSRMVDEALLETPWNKQQEFRDSQRTIWKDGAGKKFLGNFGKVGNFCRVIIHGAGHNAPHDQPETSLRMIRDFTEHGCIKTSG